MPSPQTAGLVLAGGQSRRMGSNKALLQLHGQTLIEHSIQRLQPQVTQMLVSTQAPLAIAAAIPQLTDILPDAGPLGGILTALLWLQQHTTCEWLLSVAVDTPFFPRDLREQLWRARQPQDLIISASSGGRIHPTCSLWHLSVVDSLSQYLHTDQRRVLGFIVQHSHRQVDFAITDRDPFSNFNTPDEFNSLRLS